jgi:hypothetical protein
MLERRNTRPDPYYIMRNVAPGSHVEAAYFPEVQSVGLSVTTHIRGFFGQIRAVKQTIVIDKSEINRFAQWLNGCKGVV